jgi:hypothetical protein
MRFALNSIAKESPVWLKQMFHQDWLNRYYLRGNTFRVPHLVAGRQIIAEKARV